MSKYEAYKEWAAQMAEREFIDTPTIKQYFYLSSFYKEEVRKKLVGVVHTRQRLVDVIGDAYIDMRLHFWLDDSFDTREDQD